MKDSIIKEQLAKVEQADLSNFDAKSNTYYIKKRKDIKIEADHDYLIVLKPAAFNNSAVITNWNGGSMPTTSCLKINVLKNMGKMIQVVAVDFDMQSQTSSGTFWQGWLAVSDFDIIQKL